MLANNRDQAGALGDTSSSRNSGTLQEEEICFQTVNRTSEKCQKSQNNDRRIASNNESALQNQKKRRTRDTRNGQKLNRTIGSNVSIQKIIFKK